MALVAAAVNFTDLIDCTDILGEAPHVPINSYRFDARDHRVGNSMKCVESYNKNNNILLCVGLRTPFPINSLPRCVRHVQKVIP